MKQLIYFEIVGEDESFEVYFDSGFSLYDNLSLIDKKYVGYLVYAPVSRQFINGAIKISELGLMDYIHLQLLKKD